MKRMLVVGCLVLALAPAATAAPILDQSFIPPYEFLYAQLSDLPRAQTFTVGRAGLLSHFEVLISSLGVVGAAPDFSIYPTVGGVPDLVSPPLASASISLLPDAGNTWYLANVSAAGLVVSPGDVYAIVYQAVPDLVGDVPYWVGDFNPAFPGEWGTGDYPGGASYQAEIAGPWVPVNGDLGFKTWVDAGDGPPAIPEPTSLLFLGTGLVGLVRWRKRRQ